MTENMPAAPREPAARGEHPKGTTILVLGILGLVVFQPLGVIAMVMGNKAIAEIDAAPQQYTNRTTVNAGRICGIIATVLLVIAVVIFVVLLVTGAFD